VAYNRKGATIADDNEPRRDAMMRGGKQQQQRRRRHDVPKRQCDRKGEWETGGKERQTSDV
ncbi:hypothetical protein ACRALDRAFT_1092241, partial [Sodiomyces alcalophilus JCM 7366]|uniref:uncharacterized protein n=1 Tax=Sodiomyces alcalophilus JCM 7366 TaxID=591952 RepID=UPI0039B37960